MKRQKPQNPYLAEALRNLRNRNRVSLDDVAPKLGLSKSGLHRYETMTASWPLEKVDDFLAAIGATQKDLQVEIDRLSGATEVPQIPWPHGVAPDLKTLLYQSEDMANWIEPGETAFYELGRQPKRMEGCVVVFADREPVIRLYEKISEGRVFVRRLNPEKTEDYLWSEIRGVHKIWLRGM